jgi:glycosyltransferase involved in cell wall biosynthesis
MSRGRIIFVVGSLCIGGAEKQTVGLANALDERGFETGVCYLAPRSELRAGLNARVDGRSHCLEKRSAFDIGMLRRLRRIILAQAPDVLVCVNTYPLLVADIASRLVPLRPRLVEVLHSGVLAVGTHEWSVRLWLRSVINKRCDGVVFISEVQRRHWQREYGIRSDLGTVIRNGIDTEYFKASMSADVRAAERRRLGSMPSDVVVGCCAATRAAAAACSSPRPPRSSPSSPCGGCEGVGTGHNAV